MIMLLLLLLFQAHARGSHVIIVGTFLDQIEKQQSDEIISQLKDYIYRTLSANKGFPSIDEVTNNSIQLC